MNFRSVIVTGLNFEDFAQVGIQLPARRNPIEYNKFLQNLATTPKVRRQKILLITVNDLLTFPEILVYYLGRQGYVLCPREHTLETK
jgi:hypothetical protein